MIFAILSFLLPGILLALGLVAERRREKKQEQRMRELETALGKAFERSESN